MVQLQVCDVTCTGDSKQKYGRNNSIKIVKTACYFIKDYESCLIASKAYWKTRDCWQNFGFHLFPEKLTNIIKHLKYFSFSLNSMKSFGIKRKINWYHHLPGTFARKAQMYLINLNFFTKQPKTFNFNWKIVFNF